MNRPTAVVLPEGVVAVVNEGMEEGKAIRIALAKALRWAERQVVLQENDT